ncbi:MAG: hypothetical protein ABFD64_08540 [Armatimonadota bacterium]
MIFMHGWGCDKRIINFTVIGIMVLIIACSAAVGVCASDRGVMLDVRDARLNDVVVLLTQQSGANIIVNPDVSDKRITAVVYDKPLETVLENVVRTAGVDFWKTDDGTYIIGAKRPEPAKAVEPVTAPAQQEPVEKPKYYKEKITLVYSHPVELLESMGLTFDNQPDVQKHFAKTKPVGKVLGVLDEDEYNTGIRFNNVNDQGSVPPAVDSGNSGAAVAGRSATAADGAGQYPGAGGRSGGYPSSAGSPPGMSSSRGGTGSTSNRSSSLLPDGVDLVQPFPLDNSIIVRGTWEGISEFKELIHMLDVPPKQVSIKAEFIEVTTNDVKRLGIDWSLERLNETINTNFNPSGNVIVGVTTGNLAASLRTELTKSSGNIINSPIISTLNNEYAEINIGSQIPYWTSSMVTTSTGVVSNSEVNSINIETYLRVLPRVNGDGTITLELMPSVQDTGTMYTAPDGQSQLPETRYQTLQTRRRVMSGETIVVGGFIRKDQSTSTTQIPILGSLPIIGPLFRSSSTTSEDRELLIFVTPTIIGEKSTGSSVGVSTYP